MSSNAEHMREWRKKNEAHCKAYCEKYRKENKERISSYMKEWRKKNREHIKAYKKKYEEAHPLETRTYRREYSRKYYHDNLDKSREQARNWEKANLKRLKNIYGYAHQIFQKAIDSGEIQKQPCEICGEDKAEAHHDDYNKPLEVRWLCRNCHKEWHRNNKPSYYKKGEM